MKRRDFLQSSAASVGCLAVSLSVPGSSAADAATVSEFVGVVFGEASGGSGRSQAEMWFVVLGTSVVVCVGTGSWLAQAARKGLAAARLYAVDRRGSHESGSRSIAPTDVLASVVVDRATIDAALALFAAKYRSAWDTWGPRIRSELADGSRTLLRLAANGAMVESSRQRTRDGR